MTSARQGRQILFSIPISATEEAKPEGNDGAQDTEPLPDVYAELERRERSLAEREAAFDRRARADEADRFVRIASHDLREPLKHIHAYCQLLEESLRERLEPYQMDYAERIRTNAERAVLLLDDLSTLTRLDPAGLVMVDCDLDAHLEGALQLEKHQRATAQRSLTVDHLGSIRGYADLLDKLFENLVDNAIKYSSLGHRIIVRRLSEEETGIELGYEAREDVVIRISNEVADRATIVTGGAAQGENIDRRLVLPLIRGTHNVDGSGMGLAICKRIVELHGGTLTVSSQSTGWFSADVRFPTDLLGEAS